MLKADEAANVSRREGPIVAERRHGDAAGGPTRLQEVGARIVAEAAADPADNVVVLVQALEGHIEGGTARREAVAVPARLQGLVQDVAGAGRGADKELDVAGADDLRVDNMHRRRGGRRHRLLDRSGTCARCRPCRRFLQEYDALLPVIFGPAVARDGSRPALNPAVEAGIEDKVCLVEVHLRVDVEPRTVRDEHLREGPAGIAAAFQFVRPVVVMEKVENVVDLRGADFVGHRRRIDRGQLKRDVVQNLDIVQVDRRRVALVDDLEIDRRGGRGERDHVVADAQAGCGKQFVARRRRADLRAYRDARVAGDAEADDMLLLLVVTGDGHRLSRPGIAIGGAKQPQAPGRIGD